MRTTETFGEADARATTLEGFAVKDRRPFDMNAGAQLRAEAQTARTAWSDAARLPGPGLAA